MSKKDTDDIKSAAELAMENNDVIEDGEEIPEELDQASDPEEDESYKDKYLRVRADLENIQRRMRDERSKQHLNTLSVFMKDILPFIDSLEKAVLSCQDEESEMAVGVRLTQTLLNKVLKDNHVKKIDTEGLFDEKLHEAVTTIPNSDVEPNTILEVVESGYIMADRVIRYAKVVVSASSSESEEN